MNDRPCQIDPRIIVLVEASTVALKLREHFFKRHVRDVKLTLSTFPSSSLILLHSNRIAVSK